MCLLAPTGCPPVPWRRERPGACSIFVLDAMPRRTASFRHSRRVAPARPRRGGLFHARTRCARSRRKPGWTGFAMRRRGGSTRRHRGTARRRAMPDRILIQCLEAAAGRRGEPGPRAMRRLTGAAKARLLPVGGRARPTSCGWIGCIGTSAAARGWTRKTRRPPCPARPGARVRAAAGAVALQGRVRRPRLRQVACLRRAAGAALHRGGAAAGGVHPRGAALARPVGQAADRGQDPGAGRRAATSRCRPTAS